MKKFTIIGGVNGVGKSSLSGVLSNDLADLGIIIDTDKITAQLGGDKLSGGKKAVELIEDCIGRGINFTQETTLSGKKTLKTILSARENDYYIRLYYVAVNTAEESLLRIENRVRRGGHNISENDVKRRFEKRFEDLTAILPYCNEAFFFDNENGFVKVADYRNGILELSGKDAPEWILSLKRSLEDNL